MVSSLLWALVGGTVLGLLGKSLAPGEPDHVPLWLAILGGIGGALLGTWLYSLAYQGAGTGTDWWRHAWQVVTAALLVLVVVAVATLAGRHVDRRPPI